MGIWDSIKKAKNYLTGGGAKMDIKFLEEPHLRKPFKVKVTAVIEDADIEADKIYLIVQNTEHVQLEVRTTGAAGKTQNRTHTERKTLFKEEIILDEMLMLNNNEQYSYETDITLPAEVFPAFEGVNAKFTWSLQAYIEKSGNNPESKKIFFEPIYSIQ